MAYLRIGNKEKRDYIRMNIETGISCKIRATGDSFNGQCQNLSHTGMQFVTSIQLKNGEELEITLKSSDVTAQPPLKANMLVKRVNKNSNGEYIVSGELKNVK